MPPWSTVGAMQWAPQYCYFSNEYISKRSAHQANPQRSWLVWHTVSQSLYMLVFHRGQCCSDLAPYCSHWSPAPIHVPEFRLTLRARPQMQHLANVQTFISGSAWTYVPSLLTNTSNSTSLSLNSLSSTQCFHPSNDPETPWATRDSSFIPGTERIAKSYWFYFCSSLKPLLCPLTVQLCPSPTVFPSSLLTALDMLSPYGLTLFSQVFKPTDTKSDHASLCLGSSPGAGDGSAGEVLDALAREAAFQPHHPLL